MAEISHSLFFFKKMNKDKPTTIIAGNKYWRNDKWELHRKDGPACEYANGSKGWWINGNLHRLDGPAIERANGTKIWYIHGIKYSEEDFKLKVAEMSKDKPTKIDENGNKFWENDKGQLHREDGPAVERADGSKSWWVNGQFHREDGPAIERADGSKSWYLNGKKHRLDGPAIEYPNGSKEWYVNGQLHREDGPAREYAYGDKEYYLNGKKYTRPKFIQFLKENNLPIPNLKDLARYLSKDKLSTVDENGKPTEIDKDGDKYWRNNKGRLHREDGPAIEEASGYKAWYVNGKLHREDGPAIEYSNGSKSWYIDGQRHREDGPAFEYVDGSKEWWIAGKKYSEKEFELKIAKINKNKPTEIDENGNKYWKNAKGELHRLDGPACEYTDGTKEWYINGQHHRKDGPAIEWADGSKHWYINGKRHRLDGPAIEYSDGNKEWLVDGERHRLDGPAVEGADGNKYWYLNGENYSEEDFKLKIAELNKNKPTGIDENGNKYWKNDKGEYHRLDGPAYEGYNGYKEWWINGKLHREDGPAIERADGSKLWFVNGQCHRLDGPACEWSNGGKECFINGEKYTEEEFKLKIAELNKDKNINNLNLKTSKTEILSKEIKVEGEIEKTINPSPEKTLNIIMNAGKHGISLSLAKEPIKIFNNIALSIIKNMLIKYGYDTSKLDNPFVDKILEFISPIILHIIFENNLIKTNYNDKIKYISELAIEYSVTKNIMDYSDILYNLFKVILTDEIYRNKIATAIKIGVALENNDKTNLQNILYPIDNELLESQKKLEALIG